MERIVNRSDLRSSSSVSSISPPPEAIERLKEKTTTVETGSLPEKSANADTDEDEYDFRLFHPTKAVASEQSEGHVHKIKLRSPPISKEHAGFIQPQRDSKYYFTRSGSSVEQQNFESTALTGEDILSNARIAWPGSSYRWKVLHLPITNVAKSLRPQMTQPFKRLVGDDRSSKRIRPGKQYRIKLRQKRAAILAQQDATRAAAAEKEAAEREKRTRRNREKKVKKRLRDKSKKAAAAAEAAADPDAAIS